LEKVDIPGDFQYSIDLYEPCGTEVGILECGQA